MANNIPLWFKSGLKLPFRKSWYQIGYFWVSDIMNEDGILHFRDKMSEDGLNINVLDYERLKSDILKLNIIQGRAIEYGPHIPYTLFKIGYQVKGSAKIYNLLMEFSHNIIIEFKNRWEETLNEEIPYHRIEQSFSNIQTMKEGPFAKYIQYKLLHRRIVTNKKLFNMGFEEKKTCPYYEISIETKEHAFLNCDTVRKLWHENEQWFRSNIDRTIRISDMDEILGQGENDYIVDKTIMATICVIYRNRQLAKQYNFKEETIFLRAQMILEEYHANIGCDILFLKTWERAHAALY